MRKTIALVRSAGLGLAALAGAALADKGPGMFGRADTNRDGYVSKEEFAAGRDKKATGGQRSRPKPRCQRLFRRVISLARVVRIKSSKWNRLRDGNVDSRTFPGVFLLPCSVKVR